MERGKYIPLDMNKIKAKPSVVLSSKEALKDVTPLEIREEVRTGKSKIIVTKL